MLLIQYLDFKSDGESGAYHPSYHCFDGVHH